MQIKDYVNWFYKEKIEGKDPTHLERETYGMLCLFYVLTYNYGLISDLNKDSEMIQVSDGIGITMTFYIYGPEVLIRRENKNEIVKTADGLIDAIYWISHKY